MWFEQNRCIVPLYTGEEYKRGGLITVEYVTLLSAPGKPFGCVLVIEVLRKTSVPDGG